MTDKESPAPPPRRNRLSILLAALLVVLGAAVVAYRWSIRPPAVAPAAGRGVDFGTERVRAKGLPEYAEVRGVAQPLTDAQVTRLIELSRHPNAWIRTEASGRLTWVRGGPRRAETVNAVAAGLADEHDNMQALALSCLEQMDTREREADIRAPLTGDDVHLREHARHALERMGLPAERRVLGRVGESARGSLALGLRLVGHRRE